MDSYERNLHRKQEIEDALLQLMETLPYSQITVTRLSEHLHISRKSFYHYYPNLEACLESLIDRMIQDAALYAATSVYSSYYTVGSQDAYIRNLEYWKSQARFLEAISRHRLSEIFLERYMAYIRREDTSLQKLMSSPGMDFDEDILLFYASGQMSLLMRWCQRGFDLPVQELARKYVRLLCTPLLRTGES